MNLGGSCYFFWPEIQFSSRKQTLPENLQTQQWIPLLFPSLHRLLEPTNKSHKVQGCTYIRKIVLLFQLEFPRSPISLANSNQIFYHFSKIPYRRQPLYTTPKVMTDPRYDMPTIIKYFYFRFQTIIKLHKIGSLLLLIPLHFLWVWIRN